MSDRIVVGYFGSRESLASTIRAAAPRGVDVVAVAFDLGGPIPLSSLRDDALALGAVRCHALDVREDFAREVIVAALSASDFETTLAELAERFVRQSLESIAKLEAATFVEPGGIDLPWRNRSDRRAAQGPATISLNFAQRIPVELNGITMTPAEILDSLETITGLPASDVLHTAYQDLSSSLDGTVDLRAADGRVEVKSRLVAS